MPALTTRVLLISHASTSALRAARFPLDEAVDEQGASKTAALRLTLESSLGLRLGLRLGSAVDQAFCGPCRRTRDTALGLGLDARPEPALRDLDAGRWAGRSIEELLDAEPEAVGAWMTDAHAAPHGGESVAALMLRVSAWLDARRSAGPGRIVAVTHPAVMRAAVLHVVGAPSGSFWAVDVAPLTVIRMQCTRDRWRLRFGPAT